MWPPALLSERTRAEQIAGVLVAPAVLGAVAGVLLGVSEGAYLVISIIAFVGGILAGFEHRSAGAGAKRGLLGGTIYGAFILIAHAITGADAKADLPDPEIVLVVVTALFGAGLGALGAALRGRRSRA